MTQPIREIKNDSYMSKCVERVVKLLMDYTDLHGDKIFEQFKGKIFYNTKLSIPTSKYPALFVYIGDVSREPFGIKRQDLWNINVRLLLYTLDHSENDMDIHYKWVEGIDRVFRVNPRMHITGDIDLGIHKGDLESASFNFAFGDNFVISETDATITIKTKLCLANQIS